MKIEKGKDYWYVQITNCNATVCADTNNYMIKTQPEWNMFASRQEAERALAKIVLLLTEPDPSEDTGEEKV